MYRIKSYIPLEVIKQITVLFSRTYVLHYCSLVWDFTSRAEIKCLFRQQTKGMRAEMQIISIKMESFLPAPNFSSTVILF